MNKTISEIQKIIKLRQTALTAAMGSDSKRAKSECIARFSVIR